VRKDTTFQRKDTLRPHPEDQGRPLPRPDHRPDTAALLNLPIVKLMRKEQEVVKLGQDLKEQRMLATQREKEAVATVERMRKEIDDQLRREWEVKARLEIERQVKLLTEERVQRELALLQNKFEEEVQKRVKEALKKHPKRPSTSPKLAVRSNTPTLPAADQELLFPVEADSTSTLATNSEFASGTDISSLSLEDSLDDAAAATKPKRARAPLARARTMFAPNAPTSPMDVQMGEPSPAPASLAGLSLSPRKMVSRHNIFAAAKEGAKKWEAEVPPSPTEEEWNGDFDDDDDDDLPVLPSPTRSRSAQSGRSANDDPFKILAAAQRPLIKPHHRLGSAPSLAPGNKPRPASAVPIVATSPARPKSKSTDGTSSSPRRAHLQPTAASAARSDLASGLKSKKGNEAIRIQAMRNNGGVQGRTLVELQQARGIPVQTMSDDEGMKKGGFGFRRSPAKHRSAAPAVWDPETEPEMPSPFIVRSKRVVR
jgi:hypothetical protein